MPEALSAVTSPTIDPTPIFEIFRGSYGSELLTAAVKHFDVLSMLAVEALTLEDLQTRLGLQQRAAIVLMTALRAFGLVTQTAAGRYDLSLLAREHLIPGAPFDVSDYIGLAADSAGVRSMVERLRSNQPAGAKAHESGTAFIYRSGVPSAMESEANARALTLALAGRARNVAPSLARRVPLSDARLLLDVGGGTGIYSIACLQQHPLLRAVVWDRPEVLKVAAEMGDAYGVSNRLQCLAGDMFSDPVPPGPDVILLSNILHDWDVPENLALVQKCAQALPAGGRLIIHDVFLNDAMDGPLAVALYSAALFSLTEGRAYSGAEFRGWLKSAGLIPGEITPTLIHCGALVGTKP